jgi:hypothetical protein
MKVICAWCQTIIRAGDGSGLPDSHGICEKCRDIHYPKGGTRKSQRARRSVTPTLAYLSKSILSSAEAGGPFCHWPEVDLRVAQGDW